MRATSSLSRSANGTARSSARACGSFGPGASFRPPPEVWFVADRSAATLRTAKVATHKMHRIALTPHREYLGSVVRQGEKQTDKRRQKRRGWAGAKRDNQTSDSSPAHRCYQAIISAMSKSKSKLKIQMASELPDSWGPGGVSRGPLAEYMGGFVDDLLHRGYSMQAVGKKVRLACDLSRWMDRKRLLSERAVEAWPEAERRSIYYDALAAKSTPCGYHTARFRSSFRPRRNS